MKDDFSNKITQSISITPGPTLDCVVECYNVTFSINFMIDYLDSCIAIDNYSLYDICFKSNKLSNPNYHNLNNLATQALSGATCLNRFYST